MLLQFAWKNLIQNELALNLYIQILFINFKMMQSQSVYMFWSYFHM